MTDKTTEQKSEKPQVPAQYTLADPVHFAQNMAKVFEQAAGELGIGDDGGGAARSPSLTRLYVEPAYRRSGIAHTLLACASREFGRPIRIDTDAREWPDSPAWATLCRCLEYEGLVVVR